MDLWIRSQDKTKLIKISFIEYGEYNDIHFINGFSTNGVDNYDLGIYKSKERALEVLDEIQKILKPQLIIKDSGKIISSFEDTVIREGATYELKELSTYVYEMPKE